MTAYAILSEGHVIRTFESDAAPAAEPGETVVALTRGDIPPRPASAAFLVVTAGALAWQDPRSAAQAWADVRAKRDQFMKDTDWMVTRSVERSAALSVGWRAYRQDLRDITNQPDPFNIAWPTPPAA